MCSSDLTTRRQARRLLRALSIEPDRLVDLIGRGAGHHLHAISNNRDPRCVDTGRRRRSIGSQRSFAGGGLDRAECEAILLDVVDRVTARLRTANRVGRTVVLRLRFGDFSSATRSRTLLQATSSTDEVLRAARGLLEDNWSTCEQRGLTRLGLSIGNLGDADAVQLALALDRPSPEIDAAVDAIRDRHGRSAIDRAVLLHRDRRTVPLLPD